MDSNLLIVVGSVSLGCVGFLIGFLIQKKQKEAGTLKPEHQLFRNNPFK